MVEEIQKEKQEKINKVLKKYLSEEDIKNYNNVANSMGVMFGLMFMLEENKIFEALGEESTTKIKESFDILINYGGLGLESKIGEETSTKIRKELIEKNLV